MVLLDVRKCMEVNLGFFMSFLRIKLIDVDIVMKIIDFELKKVDIGKKNVKEILEKKIYNIFNEIMNLKLLVEIDFDEFVKIKEIDFC